MKAIMISITPLDALQRLRQNNIDNTHLFDDKLFDIIEITLKENEYLKTELLGQSQELNIKNKALEIIKEYILKNLVFDDEYQGINFSFGLYTLYISIKDKTKYNILKGALL